MFEEYLQDADKFLSTARVFSSEGNDREAKRHFRASVFHTAGAIEAFINYIAIGFENLEHVSEHESCYLNDKAIVFTVPKGRHERIEYHPIDEKIRLLVKKFAPEYKLDCSTWSSFIEFKDFRDILVHPRKFDDDITIEEYERKVSMGIKATIEIMNLLAQAIYGKPLGKRLLDLLPE